MGTTKSQYVKTTKTKTTTYHQKKGSSSSGKCPVCGRSYNKKG